MSKQVKVEGKLISVPDDATPDEIDQIAHPYPDNPSDKIARVKPPVPTELQGPAPSRFKQVMQNLPGSIIDSGKRLLQGPSMGGVSRDSQGNIDMNAGLHPLIDSFKQGSIRPLIDAATNDPVNAYQTVVGAGKGMGENTTAAPFVRGAVNAAKDQVRPVLSNFSLIHPLRNAPALYDAAKNTLEGGTRAVENSKGTPLPDPGDMPNRGNVFKQQMKKFGSSEKGESDVDAMNNVYRKVFKPALTFSGHENESSTSSGSQPQVASPAATVPPAATQTRTVQPPEQAGTQPPETPMNAPKPFSTSEKTPDIHDQIASAGIAKRAADSRAKYEDVYQNVIKGQYTPEQLRNMTPELQTEIDMRIKNMKHPEEHPNVGKKKYGTGLNPAVTESLAQRLESEK